MSTSKHAVPIVGRANRIDPSWRVDEIRERCARIKRFPIRDLQAQFAREIIECANAYLKEIGADAQ